MLTIITSSHETYDEVRRLGMRPDTEALVRQVCRC
jgi:hypothetical protein